MMTLFTIVWFVWKLFVGSVAISAVADTKRTWGSLQAVGLSAGLLALYFFVPLGGIFALGGSFGALAMARGERRRLGLQA